MKLQVSTLSIRRLLLPSCGNHSVERGDADKFGKDALQAKENKVYKYTRPRAASHPTVEQAQSRSTTPMNE